MSRLATLSEEPTNEEDDQHYNSTKSSSNGSKKSAQKTWRNWLKTHFFSLLFKEKSDDLRILLSVLGCPLSPVSLRPKSLPTNVSQVWIEKMKTEGTVEVRRENVLICTVQYTFIQLRCAEWIPRGFGHMFTMPVSSSAQYIIQHFTAATGCRKLDGTVKNTYVTGRVTMGMIDDQLGSAGGAATGVPQKGCYVMWQMVPNKWLIELVVSGRKVVAGSDGSVAWRHTPWLGSHTAKGGVRPLRRALQGLDPVAVSDMFSLAEYIGEKQIMAVDCFVLKLSADQTDLVDRGDNTAETIKHVMFGYFSQRSGLLVYLEDSYLTRIQCPGACPMYWETTMFTQIEDYRTVEGVMIAHSGLSSTIITRFGDNLKAGPALTRMEEAWTIDDVAFNVPGLSGDCFIPPGEVQRDYPR